MEQKIEHIVNLNIKQWIQSLQLTALPTWWHSHLVEALPLTALQAAVLWSVQGAAFLLEAPPTRQTTDDKNQPTLLVWYLCTNTFMCTILNMSNYEKSWLHTFTLIWAL